MPRHKWVLRGAAKTGAIKLGGHIIGTLALSRDHKHLSIAGNFAVHLSVPNAFKINRHLKQLAGDAEPDGGAQMAVNLTNPECVPAFPLRGRVFALNP